MTFASDQPFKSGRDEASILEKSKHFAADTNATAQEMTKNAVREMAEIVNTLKTTLKDLGVDTEQMMETAKSEAASIENQIAKEVAERPLRSLAIAGCIGLAFGFLARK